ncbi:MAG: hypothetical protein ACFE7E_08180 [Candidatus Hodarchaeota archaeon]
MGLFNSFLGRKNDPEEELRQFEEKIQKQKDHLFGIYLYFRGVELMYSDQFEIIEMNRKSFENIRERTERSITKAELLLLEVRGDPSKAKKLKRFKFQPTRGHPMLNQMTQRVEILLQTYNRLFPRRSKSQSLDQEELRQLMMEASEQL